MNTLLHKLKIKVHPLVTKVLLLSWLAISLLLTVLSGELRRFQRSLLAALSSSCLRAIAIIYGGTVSYEVTPNSKFGANFEVYLDSRHNTIWDVSLCLAWLLRRDEP